MVPFVPAELVVGLDPGAEGGLGFPVLLLGVRDLPGTGGLLWVGDPGRGGCLLLVLELLLGPTARFTTRNLGSYCTQPRWGPF